MGYGTAASTASLSAIGPCFISSSLASFTPWGSRTYQQMSLPNRCSISLCSALPLGSLSVNMMTFLTSNGQFCRATKRLSLSSPLNSLGAPLGRVVAFLYPISARLNTSISPSTQMISSNLWQLS